MNPIEQPPQVNWAHLREEFEAVYINHILNQPEKPKTPREQAIELYRPSNLSFQDDVDDHMACGGYIILTPEVYILARPVRHDWPADKIANAAISEPKETADCWFIWLLCGSLREAVKHLPYRLPWFGFAQRGGPARFLPAEKVLAKIG